ncbi:MAG: RHS repeat-associated core domain-containing protein [Lachnospiraceae bacterium]|nr:RHS repeat-associated core domain-containing protein [Lachnospiraceae bacterium]
MNGTKLTAPSEAVSGEVAKNNLLELLPAETERKDRLSLSGSQLSVDTATYVTDPVSLSGSKITINKPVVATGDISVSASDVTIAEGAALVSLNGSVNLYCTNLTANGPVWAANKLFITGSKTTVNEGAFAKTIEIYTGTYTTDGTVKESVRKGQRNKTAGLTLYGMDDKNMLFANANFDYATMDVYGRKNGENSFTLLQANITDEDFEVPSSWSVYTDFAAVLKNEFGFYFKTEPLSIAIEENTWFSSYGVDMDEDSVPDAFELWLAGTDPNTPDTFPNPEFYVYLAGEEETTCYDRLLCRDVSVTKKAFTKTFIYGDMDYPGRATGANVCYTDGTTKRIRYEYENDRLKTLHVGGNTYTIRENENSVRYFVNNTCIKQASQTGNECTYNYFDTMQAVTGFDSEGNLVSFYNGSLYEMTYDDLLLLVGLAKNGASYESYTYDDYGNCLSIDASDYSIHYTFDYPLYQADYTFGAQNSIQKTQKVNCADGDYGYGEAVLLTDGTNGANIPQSFIGEMISFDSDTKALQYRIGEETYTVKFNARGYVEKDTVTKEGSSDTTVNEYSYDAYGNLQTVKTTKNGQTTVQRYSYSSAWSDELTSFDGRSTTYGTFGKPVEYYNGMSFTWAAGKLATVRNGETSASYLYDYQGLREEKIVNGATTRYIYEGHDLIAELSADPIYFTYDGTFHLVGFEWNGAAYYYQYDIFGDVVGIVNAAGETLCTYSYDLWGAITEITGDQTLAERNPIRYRGYYYDNETGFYYLETRYYDPQVKRFLSYDDLESFFYGAEEDMESLFVYCGNNPVRNWDFDGRYYAINTVLTLTDPDSVFEEESRDWILPDIQKYARGKYGVSTTSIAGVTDKKSFIGKWNAMPSEQAFVVVNTHGQPTYLNGSSNDRPFQMFHINDVKELEYKKIKAIILLGCNCGHYSFRDYNRYGIANIARVFADKFGTVVIASDGNVRAYSYASVPLTQKERGDAWSKYVNDGRTNNVGWIEYTKKGLDNHYTGYLVLGHTNGWKPSEMLKYCGF